MIAEEIVATRQATPAWLYPNLLSLDAPLVAILWQCLFSVCYLGRFDAAAGVILALCVWLIYAADRIWDRTSMQPRHVFHRRYRGVILPFCAAALLVAAWLAWMKLAPSIAMRGLAVFAAVAFFFVVTHVRRKPWPKELMVAIVFACGVSISAWSAVQAWTDWAMIAAFAMLCWINCAAIEQWEGRSLQEWPVRSAAIVVGLFALVLLYDRRPILAGAVTASAFAFVLLDHAKVRLSANGLRVLADVALLTPALFLPIAILRK